MGWIDRLCARGERRNGGGFLARLRHARGGNTLAIMAAMMIPMSALAGSAVDMARLYVVKVRLQQACDAGALAGRKFMTNSGSTLDSNATTQANAFFANNFKKDTSPTSPGYMTSTGVSFTPTKTADSQVAGAAQATVPMTLMKMFGYTSTTLNVTCQARYDIADADVMFVLDTTGSMACTVAHNSCSRPYGTYTRADGTTGYYETEESGSKISTLRTAVLNFYDTVTANSDSSTNVRYGFVSYAGTVNVGKVLYAMNPAYLATKWNYQSRVPVADYTISSTLANTYTNITSNNCNKKTVARSPSTALTYNSSTGTATDTTVVYTTASSGTCKVYNNVYGPTWQYQQTTYNLSSFLAGGSIDDPSKVDTSQTKWSGCVEERHSAAGTMTFDINNLAPDMDPDLVPTTTNANSLWRPYWPDVIYWRGTSTSNPNPTSDGDSSTYFSYGSAASQKNENSACGKPALRLAVMSRADVSNYVNASDFEPMGSTYHDAGMTWGLRMISPTGIFAADTAAAAGHNPPNRFIVFMTDGLMSPALNFYGAHAVEDYDKRVTNGDFSSQMDYHNARFLAECSAAKARNITVFVVGFGQTLSSQLTDCASPGQAYYASDDAALNTAFTTIATQVARLRISQ